MQSKIVSTTSSNKKYNLWQHDTGCIVLFPIPVEELSFNAQGVLVHSTAKEGTLAWTCKEPENYKPFRGILQLSQ